MLDETLVQVHQNLFLIVSLANYKRLDAKGNLRTDSQNSHQLVAQLPTERFVKQLSFFEGSMCK